MTLFLFIFWFLLQNSMHTHELFFFFNYNPRLQGGEIASKFVTGVITFLVQFIEEYSISWRSRLGVLILKPTVANSHHVSLSWCLTSHLKSATWLLCFFHIAAAPVFISLPFLALVSWRTYGFGKKDGSDTRVWVNGRFVKKKKKMRKEKKMQKNILTFDK